MMITRCSRMLREAFERGSVQFAPGAEWLACKKRPTTHSSQAHSEYDVRPEPPVLWCLIRFGARYLCISLLRSPACFERWPKTCLSQSLWARVRLSHIFMYIMCTSVSLRSLSAMCIWCLLIKPPFCGRISPRSLSRAVRERKQTNET